MSVGFSRADSVTTKRLSFAFATVAVIVFANASALAGDVSMTSWADIVQRVSPAVVSLTTKAGLGSGFVIDSQGHIVTNNHVMGTATEADVRFADGTKLKARLLGRDEETDIALLKVESTKALASVKFENDRRVRVGDFVLAVGNPFGLGGTATAGILSARGRDELASGQFTEYLQLDAPINPGNSGGPTFDTNGRVIGMNTIGRQGTSIGFAIPSSTIQRVVADLIAGRTVSRGYLGVQIAALSDEDAKALGLPNSNGALVTTVIEGSPAEKAGIKRGDVILKINGQAVKDNREASRKIANLGANQTAVFTIWRTNAELKISVTLVQRDSMAQAPEANPQFKQTSMGLALQTITDVTRSDYSFAKDVSGVLIMGIDEESHAGQSSLRPGDRIVGAGTSNVSTLDDVNLAIEQAKSLKRDSLLLFVVSQAGTQSHVSIKLNSK